MKFVAEPSIPAYPHLLGPLAFNRQSYFHRELRQRGWRKLQQAPGHLKYLYITQQRNSTTFGYLATIQMVSTPPATTSVELRLSSYYNVFEPISVP